jgi:STE24 endopeptidase
MTKSVTWLFAAVLVCGLSAAPVLAQEGPIAAPTTQVEVEQLAPPGAPHFDVNKAVNAYLSRIGGKARAKSDAYSNGGTVLQVVDVLYALIVAGLLLWLRLSSAMRNFAAGITRSRFWQAAIYATLYMAVTTAATLPVAFYEGYLREHAYGLSNQSFAAWAGDFATAFAVNLIGFTVVMTLIYAAMRRAGRIWWLWGGGIAVIFLIVFTVAGPVFIAPMFNHYSKLPDSTLKSTILSEARANGIPAKNVYVYDASRQTKDISANVSGLFGTTRISLSDNLLNDCTPSEGIAVVGHEMGHYAMGHVAIAITWLGLFLLLGFAVADWMFRGLVGLFGGNWDVRTIDDPAGMPLLIVLLTVLNFLASPLTNTISRTQEAQADIFGLNAVRQPDAFATAVLKLSPTRKLDPSSWEEFIFYDHPSGRTRITEAMRWKAEHLSDPDIEAGPISPQ